MIADGRLTEDKRDALHGGTILYHKYPFTLTLFLWDLLGREFVNDGKPFDIFDASEPCNAFMGDYMHLVEGSGNRGETFYYYTTEKDQDKIYCGIGDYKVDCIPANYRERARRGLRVNWRFSHDKPALIFLYDAEKIRPPISVLMDGTMEHVDRLREKVHEIFGNGNYERFQHGIKYWCWDMVVTELVKRLEKDRLLEKEGDGIYTFQSIE
jgi:hypothetical protein